MFKKYLLAVRGIALVVLLLGLILTKQFGLLIIMLGLLGLLSYYIPEGGFKKAGTEDTTDCY